jgi:hypothetical protein
MQIARPRDAGTCPSREVISCCSSYLLPPRLVAILARYWKITRQEHAGVPGLLSPGHSLLSFPSPNIYVRVHQGGVAQYERLVRQTMADGQRGPKQEYHLVVLVVEQPQNTDARQA